MSLKEFRDLLINITNEKILDELYQSEREKISLKVNLLNLEKQVWDKKIQELGIETKPNSDICRRCVEKHGNGNRRFNIPGWQGELDFKKTHVKNCMLIGSDYSGKIGVEIAYDLGKTTINPEKKKNINRLWKKIKIIFGQEHFESFLNNLYLTDVCKCQSSSIYGKNSVRKNCILITCASNYLLEEIILINPKFIIFQGDLAFKIMKCVTDVSIDNSSSIHFPDEYFTQCGTILVGKNQIPFIKVYHLGTGRKIADFNNNENSKVLKSYNKFFQKQILSLLE